MSLVLYLYDTCFHANLCLVLMNMNYILLDFSQSSWPVHLRMLVFVLSNEVSWLDFPITVQCDIPLLANASGTSLNALSICYGSINYVCSFPWFIHRHRLKTLVAVYKVFKIKDHKAFDLGGGWGWKRILGWKSFLRQKLPTLNYFKSTQQVCAIRMWRRIPQFSVSVMDFQLRDFLDNMRFMQPCWATRPRDDLHVFLTWGLYLVASTASNCGLYCKWR